MKKFSIDKRLMSLALAVLMMVSMMSVSAMAADTSTNTLQDINPEGSNSQPATVYDVVNALYTLDDEPLMIDQIYNATHVTYTQDPLVWSIAYDILPDDFDLSAEITRAETAEILYHYAQHHDIDVSVDRTTGLEHPLHQCEDTASAVEWILENNIMFTDDNGCFNGDETVSLLDLSGILTNYQSAQLSTVGVVADGLTLTYPSENQMTINPLCDFYVIGDIEDTVSVPDDALLTVQLIDSDGDVMREIYTDIKDNQAGMYVDYPGIVITGSKEAFRSSLMPDLVYDPDDPSSFDNTWIKAYYTDEHYTCVVYGGSYREDINPLDQYGHTLTPLPEGDYELSVSLTSDSDVLASLQVQLTIGVVAKKVLARFSPSSYLRAVKEFASENGLTVYTDPFPGYWNTKDLLPTWGTDYLGVIEKRWVLADRQGYIGGMTYFFDYNITATSTSYRVELGQLAYDKALDNRDSITYCYYDIGEPQIIQDGKTYNGKFVTVDLDNMDSVRFTRADYSYTETPENYISPEILSDTTSQFNLDERFIVNPGETVSLNGICKVIQPKDVVFLPETESFVIGNRVAAIRYTIRDAFGNVYATVDKEVSGLVREFDNGSTSTSILEFRHNFTVEENMRGNDMRIFAQALDEESNPVGGMVYGCIFRVPRE